VARKLPGLKRELDARAFFSVAYGEIASSIYFALGVVAAHALGFTPVVLLVAGVVFLIVSLSYAEGTAALVWAATHNDLAMADLLLKAGASAKAANEFGATALYAAAEQSDPAMATKRAQTLLFRFPTEALP